MKTLITSIALVLISVSGFAHALRIETAPVGAENKAHEIKVFYGELAEGQDEEFEKWYSDVKDFKLYLVSPSGVKS